MGRGLSTHPPHDRGIRKGDKFSRAKIIFLKVPQRSNDVRHVKMLVVELMMHSILFFARRALARKISQCHFLSSRFVTSAARPARCILAARGAL